MNRRLKRWLCFAMLGTLAFWQASLVLAACAMDRGQLGQMAAVMDDQGCCDEGMQSGNDVMPMTSNACFTHATSDLQAVAMPPAVPVMPTAVVLLVPRQQIARPVAWSPALTPPAVPPRILLHSFLI